MFERYTEKARRAIFYARYEASHYGSSTIDTNHLLLGLVREATGILRWAPALRADDVRKHMDANLPHLEPLPPSIGLPLSSDGKQALDFARDEADRMGHRYIGTEHLFLSILGVEDSFAARLLRNGGADAPSMRVELAEPSAQSRIPRPPGSYGGMRHREVSENTVEIHGTQWNADYIRDLLSVIRASNWHWQGSKWKARDIAISRTDGTCSFNLDLANASGDFALVENGWKKDHCLVCRWDLFEAEDEHGVGYTNGQNWLCVECYQRFWQHPDFFSSSQSEMT